MFENILDPRSAQRFITEQQTPPEAIPTPFDKWNRQCRGDGGRMGVALGWHILLAGAVNQGKSGMMLNLVDKTLKSGYDAAVFSLEMSLSAIKYRYYPIMTGIEAEGLERGYVNQESAAELVAILGRLAKGEQRHRLFVNEKPNRDLNAVLDGMYELEEMGVRVFFVDYLQLMKAGASEREERHRVAEISSAMFQFAHETNVLTVGLSQFARTTTRDRDNKPIMEGMYGSSSLEADADQVVLLDHSRYKADEIRPWLHRTFLLLAKNRHGGKGDIPFEWNWKTFQAREAMEDEVHLWPGENGNGQRMAQDGVI
jgi:replicative DNA helicase